MGRGFSTRIATCLGLIAKDAYHQKKAEKKKYTHRARERRGGGERAGFM